jgi:hypothetical protein
LSEIHHCTLKKKKKKKHDSARAQLLHVLSNLTDHQRVKLNPGSRSRFELLYLAFLVDSFTHNDTGRSPQDWAELLWTTRLHALTSRADGSVDPVMSQAVEHDFLQLTSKTSLATQALIERVRKVIDSEKPSKPPQAGRPKQRGAKRTSLAAPTASSTPTKKTRTDDKPTPIPK